jgi:hypothetical protein
MVQLNRRSASEASQKARSGYRTLPPPEWTSPETTGPAPAALTPTPIARRTGSRAEEAWLQARVREARKSGDAASLRDASRTLARWLASRDRDLDQAVELGTTALKCGEDVELRREVAAWLESLGEPARAAALLKPIASLTDVDSGDAGYVLVRVGILRARAGAAAAAAAAFEAAISVDGADALASELLASLHAWQPGVVPAAAAIDSYLESARRRAAHKQSEAELLDLWRAFEADPSSDVAARALSAALQARSRPSAADEVQRAHAAAVAQITPLAAGRVHPRGRARAIASDLTAHAFSAAVDEHLTRRVGGDESEADPRSARSVAALADASAARPGDPGAAAAIERAISMIGPRAAWCSALADALEGSGEAKLAADWSQRLLAIRPGDRKAIELVLARLVRAGDASRLRDALAWLLGQPQPAVWAAERFAAALSELARLDAARASAVARRALDVFGPQLPALREAMLGVASRTSDDAFSVAIFERSLSCPRDDAMDRAALIARLAKLRLRLGDDEGVARIVARAVSEGLPEPEFEAHIDAAAASGASPDAQLWRLRAAAWRLSSGDNPAAAAWAWRELGAALWDWADDRDAAIDAWMRAATLTPGGYATLALDLTTFAGAPFACGYLARIADAESDDSISAAIATDAARVALSFGEPRLAFDLASRGLARSPASTEALEAAEIAASGAGEETGLSGLYELVASRAMGRFGRRAAHYRAARWFAQKGLHALALKHAAQAFFAVPAEGPTLQSLARLADRAGDRLLAVRTVEQVAEREKTAIARAAWLQRAASIAGEGEDAVRSRVDLLLRAFLASPSLKGVDLLGAAARELLRFGPEERDGLELRLGHAARSTRSQLQGLEGARVAIALALPLLDLFADSDAALALLERAFACDPDVDEYGELAPWAGVLGQAPGASRRIAAMLAAVDDPHANVGVSALGLLAAIAAAVGDDASRARASVAAALRAPDNDALVIAADDALRSLRSAPAWSPAIDQHISERLGPARRAGALLTAARSRAASGAYGDAAALFERAVDLFGPNASSDLEHELRSALDAAGRGSEIEARALREASAVSASPAARADAWTLVAELREGHGNGAGAAQALREACRLDPDPLARWSALERVAELAGDDDARIESLEGILDRVGDDGRTNVLKRLARAQERRGNLAAAEHTWRRVFELDSEDEKVDQSIQSLIVARGDYEALVDHLAERAARLSARPDNRELLRAVRLRRAAILEQRLGRTSDACDELERLLREWPDSVVALRYLADLFDRQANFVGSLPLWRRAAALEGNQPDSEDLELRAARASHATGDLAGAHQHAGRVLARLPIEGPGTTQARLESRLGEALTLRIEAARALGADADLGDALDALASRPTHDAPARADLLLESASAAAKAGDLSRALDRAKRAAEAVPESTAPRLLARALEYRMRGAGAPDEARSTIEELSRIGGSLGRDDAALRAFLLAESLDVVQGGGAGLRELEATRAAIGDHALLAVGIAERFAAQGQYDEAAQFYRTAWCGPLLELRRKAAVALAGAEVAVRAGRNEDAIALVEVAEQHEESRAAAAALRERLLAGPPTVEPAADVRLYDLEAAVHQATRPDQRARARLALARGRLDFGDVRGAEPLLWEALADGLAEAGDLLAPIIASSPERAPELVRVRWQLVALEPGDLERLESLRAAALADDDRVHARAVEHVLRAFDGFSGPIPPPALAAQPEQPGILALLSRPSMDAAGEALALLWEGAMQLFVRDAASYGITGVERVEPGPSSVVSRLYEATVRVLDVPRVPLFVVRSQGSPVQSRAALLSPPSVILTGDVQQETAELSFELGRGLAAALPHHVLRQALPEGEGRAVIDALQTAFGAPERGRQVDARVARLAESFWQIIPASAQRRLQDLLRSTVLGDHDELVENARQSGRRIGMFLAGDFACAARSLLSESIVHDIPTVTPPSLGNLRELCLAVPALADLVRLAVRSEYADARWHSIGSASPRRTVSSGRFSLF